MPNPTYQQAIVNAVGPTASDEPLWTGRVAWTLDEDSIESIDVDALPIGIDDAITIYARNGSATVDMVVNVGLNLACLPEGVTTNTATAATATGGASDYFTTGSAHGLLVGDAIVVAESNDDLTAGTIYYVVAVPTSVRFQINTTRGAAAMNLTDTDPISYTIAEEFFALTSFTVPKFAAASSTAPVAGLEARVITGWGKHGGCIKVEKSAATAAACNCYLEIRRA